MWPNPSRMLPAASTTRSVLVMITTTATPESAAPIRSTAAACLPSTARPMGIAATSGTSEYNAVRIPTVAPLPPSSRARYEIITRTAAYTA